MKIEDKLVASVISGLKALYGQEVPEKMVQMQKTKKEFEGHLTLVVFPFLKMSRKGPEQTAQEIGEYLKANEPAVAAFNVIKGFLNLTIASATWIELLNEIQSDEQYGLVKATETSPLVMIEYSSPNTNKPLHLGHVRNNLLGNALANIVAANGNKVVKTNIVNDRGIHICKSMLAWKKYGNGETPESTGKKGDHLVGDYYVSFDKHYKAELAELMEKGMTKEEAEAASPLMQEAREMLVKWEAGDPEVRSLWEMMNSCLPVGQSSQCELLDFEVTQETDGRGIAEKLNEGMPEGLHVLDCYEAKRPVRELAALRAEVTLEYDSGIPENAAQRLQELLSRRELIIQKRTKRKDMADVDIAPMILRTDWREGENALIGTVLVQAQNPGLNPQLLEKAVERYAPELAPDFTRVTLTQTTQVD